MTSKRLTAEELQRVTAAASLLTKDFKHRMTVADLAKRVKLSENKLLQGFREKYHCGVYGYFRQERLKKVKEKLLQGVPLKTIADELGFSSKGNVSKSFRNKFEEKPSQWLQRKKGRVK